MMDICEDTKLKQFASLLLKLKALLKCPICLNVIQEAVELECNHKLCNSCYHDLSEAKLTNCPICKATIKKRCSPYKDNYCNAVGKFVSVIGMQLEGVFKQEVEMLAAPSQVNRSNSKSRLSKVFPKITNEIETYGQSKENVNRRELPVTQVKTREYLKTKLFNQNFQVDSQHNSDYDAFDRLLETSDNTLKVNRKSIRNVYSNKKRDKRNRENKILDFEDDKNKEAVLNWLNDTRNQFDRLTQTQNTLLAIDEPINLPSVSQPTMIEKQRRRAKSLDFENKQNVVTPKRYSYNHISDHDNYNIEDPNTEGIISEEKVIEKAKENVILHLLEDELLDKMDQEVIPPNRITCDNEIKEKKSDVVGISLASCNSGWTRITEMKETVDKSVKLPKQLRITLQNKEKADYRKKEIVVHIEQHKDNNLSEAKAKQHNVELVEEGLKKIEHDDKSNISKSCKAFASKMKNSQINAKSNMLPENEFGDSPITSTSVNEKDKVLKQTCKKKNNLEKSEKLTRTEHTKNSDYINLNNNQIENPKTTKSSKVDQITFEKVVQKNHSTEVVSKHYDDDILKTGSDECIIINDMVAFRDDSANPSNVNDEDLDDYDLPTQTVLGVDDSNKLRQSTNKLLSFINEYIQICSKEGSNCALDAIDQIRAHIGRLKQSNVVDASVQTSQISKQDVFVEAAFQTCNRAAQTDRITKNTCSVQTSEIRQKDATSQTEPLRSEKGIKNIPARAERKYRILDGNCTDAISNKHQESEPGGNVENELFTNSLDNVDFNTLEVVKNSSHKIDSTTDVVMKEDFSSSKNCDIPQNEVNNSKGPGCQKEDVFENARDQVLQPGKEVITKKSYFGATTSNQKRSRDESEIEEMIIPKKKCNRFIMDVLSVEFDNSLDKEETQERETHGESSTENNKINNNIPSSNIEKINSSWRASEKEKQISNQNIEDPIEKTRSFKIKRPTKYLDEYDEIIAKVSENVERLTKQAQVARETNQCPIEKNNSPMRNISTTKLEEFKEQFPGYSSDIISGTESMTASPKKRKKVKASKESIDLHNSTHCTPPNTSQTNKVLDTKATMEVCHELEDSFDEEFANIHFTAADNDEDKPKIKILANVKIKSQDNKGKVVDDDLFSDDDVVETTPPNR
ncbi:unnamed protein product [Callosobruchus maculatus]|nr:unnamed protein product [Callosobruchus maculatus]